MSIFEFKFEDSNAWIGLAIRFPKLPITSTLAAVFCFANLPSISLQVRAYTSHRQLIEVK